MFGGVGGVVVLELFYYVFGEEVVIGELVVGSCFEVGIGYWL